MRNTQNAITSFLDGGGSHTPFHGIGYYIADFVLGIFDRTKEREQEKKVEYSDHLNSRLNMLSQVKEDMSWEINHLREQIAFLRHEYDLMREDMQEQTPEEEECVSLSGEDLEVLQAMFPEIKIVDGPAEEDSL